MPSCTECLSRGIVTKAEKLALDGWLCEKHYEERNQERPQLPIAEEPK